MDNGLKTNRQPTVQRLTSLLKETEMQHQELTAERNSLVMCVNSLDREIRMLRRLADVIGETLESDANVPEPAVEGRFDESPRF